MRQGLSKVCVQALTQNKFIIERTSIYIHNQLKNRTGDNKNRTSMITTLPGTSNKRDKTWPLQK